MASRIRQYYIDSINRRAYTSLTSRINASIADFFVADEEILQVINCKPNPDLTSPLLLINDPIVGVLYAALGIAGQVATGGTWLFTDPVATQVASGIPFNAAPSALQATLRAGAATNYGSCVVTQNGPCDYYVDRVTIGPIASPPTGDGTDLFPACFVNIIPVRVGVAAAGSNPGTSDVFRIVLNQQPAAYTEGTLGSPWTALPSAAVTVTPLVTGSASPVLNAVFRISINPDAYQGSFYLTSTVLGAGNTDTATSQPISFETSDVSMQAQIIAGWGTGNEVTVTEVNSYTWDVEFSGTNILAKNLAAPTGNAAGLSVPVGLQGTFDLRTEAANSMLNNGASRSVYFQIKNDDGTSPQTWLYVNCTLQPTLISPGVLGSSNIPFPLTQAQGDVRYLKLNATNGPLTGPLALGANKITGLASPTASTDAANKAYVDAHAGGVSVYVVKSTTYTLVAGDKIASDTTSAAWTATLPTGPSVGDTIEIIDAQGTHGTNNLTLAPHGTDKINGTNSSVPLNVNGAHYLIVWVGGATGWRVI